MADSHGGTAVKEEEGEWVEGWWNFKEEVEEADEASEMVEVEVEPSAVGVAECSWMDGGENNSCGKRAATWDDNGPSNKWRRSESWDGYGRGGYGGRGYESLLELIHHICCIWIGGHVNSPVDCT